MAWWRMIARGGARWRVMARDGTDGTDGTDGADGGLDHFALSFLHTYTRASNQPLPSPRRTPSTRRQESRWVDRSPSLRLERYRSRGGREDRDRGHEEDRRTGGRRDRSCGATRLTSLSSRTIDRCRPALARSLSNSPPPPPPPHRLSTATAATMPLCWTTHAV